MTFACLVFDSTRLIGVAGLLLMLYLNPFAFVFIVACFAAIAVLIHFSKRSKSNDIPRLPD